MEEKIKLLLGMLATYVAGFLGGIDGIMVTLLVFISIDYVTGVCVAIKKKQLSSEVGFWGLVKKVCIIALIGISHIIDLNVVGSGDMFRTAVALYYIGNEGVSLIENCAMMGLPIPKKLRDILAQLKDENDDKKDDK